MGDSKPIKKFYNRICGFLSMKNISWIIFILFVLSLVPVCYLSFVNRASGDDYGYGVYTRAAWMRSHSLVEVAKAIGVTVKQYYEGWQGTWFSIAVFSLQPEVFNDNAYVIVVFLMLFLWIGSTCLLLWQIFKMECGFDGWSCILIILIYLMISIQFVPSTKSAIFWFNGCAHYMLPFSMCQIVVWALIRFTKEYRFYYLVIISILMALLGGSSYQPALFALISLVYICLLDYLENKNIKIISLVIPVLLELVGLIISMIAPGNKVRGGEKFGFSILNVLVTIGRCFTEGARTVLGYLREKPLVFVGLAVLFLIFLETCRGQNPKEGWLHSIIKILALICLYCAMQAPALYANVEVSRGVDNMNFLVFLLAAIGCIEILASCASSKLEMPKAVLHRNIVIPGLFCCIILLGCFRSNVKSGTSWLSMEYIRSGQAADYKEQMDQQTKILTDKNVKDAVIPFVNDDQGPLMSMPATANPDAWTNSVMKQFYGKNSVVAIPREDWENGKGDAFHD